MHSSDMHTYQHSVRSCQACDGEDRSRYQSQCHSSSAVLQIQWEKSLNAQSRLFAVQLTAQKALQQPAKSTVQRRRRRRAAEVSRHALSGRCSAAAAADRCRRKPAAAQERPLLSGTETHVQKRRVLRAFVKIEARHACPTHAQPGRHKNYHRRVSGSGSEPAA